MGLPTNDKNKKKGNNQKSNAAGNSKFLPKANTKGSATQRPHKAGGTRGS